MPMAALARSTAYYQPRPFSDTALRLVRRIDELPLQDPFAGARMLRERLHHWTPAGGDADVADGDHGDLSEAAHQPPASRLSDLSVSVTPGDNHTSESGVGSRYHLHSDAPWVRLSLCDPGLGQSSSVGVAAIQHVTTDFCLEAGREDVTRYGCPEIFNTDQGCQFTSQEFTGFLQDQRIQISMDGIGRWRDNVFVERLWRSFKYEEVYLHAYETVHDAQQRIAHYMTF